ncbi:HTH domain protein [compost metagenome]
MLAIVMALQQRAETAQSLADKMEVSKRTVLRDIQSLSEIGVPISALSGPGGGYRLMEGYQLPPLNLDTGEALVLLLALDAMAKYSDSPFQQARWTVTDKVKAVLPEGTLNQISSILQHVEMEVPERAYKTPLLDDIMEYTTKNKWMRALYRSQNYKRHVEIKPCRVYAAHGFWYCEAYSILHGEKRTFRVDRFVELKEMDDPNIQDIEIIKASGGNDPSIRIVAKLTYRGALLAEQDTHIGHLVGQISDEEWVIDFECPFSEWNWAISFFFHLGLDAEVMEPDKLRQELKERATQLRSRYKS